MLLILAKQEKKKWCQMYDKKYTIILLVTLYNS